jgi:hypothetical protein
MRHSALIVALEFKKLVRDTKFLILPALFYLLSFCIMLIFVPTIPGRDSVLRTFLWVMVSLSLKLSFGSLLQDNAEKNLVQMLIAERYPTNQFILIKVGLSTLVFSGFFMLMFMGGAFLQVFSLRDVLMLPVFVGTLLVLQAGVELLTLKTKKARYLCYLLLLPLEIPVFILMISHSSLSFIQLLKTMCGLGLVSIGILLSLSAYVFN